MGATTPDAIPYPEAGERVNDGHMAMRRMAERMQFHINNINTALNTHAASINQHQTDINNLNDSIGNVHASLSQDIAEAESRANQGTQNAYNALMAEIETIKQRLAAGGH